MPRWQVEQRQGDWAVVTDDGRHDTRVGSSDMARQWAEWYVSKRNMPADTTDWPLPGHLIWFEGADGESVLYVHDGEPVGTLGWNGVEWWFYGLSFELDVQEPTHIDVDPQQRADFQNEMSEVAQAPEGGARAARSAELNARIALHRDETRDLAMMRARLEARRVWRERKDGPDDP